MLRMRTITLCAHNVYSANHDDIPNLIYDFLKRDTVSSNVTLPADVTYFRTYFELGSSNKIV